MNSIFHFQICYTLRTKSFSEKNWYYSQIRTVTNQLTSPRKFIAISLFINLPLLRIRVSRGVVTDHHWGRGGADRRRRTRQKRQTVLLGRAARHPAAAWNGIDGRLVFKEGSAKDSGSFRGDARGLFWRESNCGFGARCEL
jgi:hypothetical protein